MQKFLFYFILGSLFSGCSSVQEIYFVDKSGTPLENVMCVTNEKNIWSNKIRISQSDQNGKLKIKMAGYGTFYAGKVGYKPIIFEIEKRNPETFVLNTDCGTNINVEYSRVLMEKSANKKVVGSDLWLKWRDYLLWLDNEGYFSLESRKKYDSIIFR